MESLELVFVEPLELPESLELELVELLEPPELLELELVELLEPPVTGSVALDWFFGPLPAELVEVAAELLPDPQATIVAAKQTPRIKSTKRFLFVEMVRPLEVLRR